MLQLITHPYLFVLIISVSQDNTWVIYWNQVIVQPTGAFMTVSFVCGRWNFSWGWRQAKEHAFHSHTDGATSDSITFSWIWRKQILKHTYLQTDGKYHSKSSVFTVTKLIKEEVHWDSLETKQIFLFKKKLLIGRYINFRWCSGCNRFKWLCLSSHWRCFLGLPWWSRG